MNFPLFYPNGEFPMLRYFVANLAWFRKCGIGFWGHQWLPRSPPAKDVVEYKESNQEQEWEVGDKTVRQKHDEVISPPAIVLPNRCIQKTQGWIRVDRNTHDASTKVFLLFAPTLVDKRNLCTGCGKKNVGLHEKGFFLLRIKSQFHSWGIFKIRWYFLSFECTFHTQTVAIQSHKTLSK